MSVVYFMKKDNSSVAEIHEKIGDFFTCEAGRIKFMVEGELIDSWTKEEYEIRGKATSKGIEVILNPGDSLWVPAGQAHQHFQLEDVIAEVQVLKVPME